MGGFSDSPRQEDPIQSQYTLASPNLSNPPSAYDAYLGYAMGAGHIGSEEEHAMREEEGHTSFKEKKDNYDWQPQLLKVPADPLYFLSFIGSDLILQIANDKLPSYCIAYNIG